jgi:hypothetical protein
MQVMPLMVVAKDPSTQLNLFARQTKPIRWCLRSRVCLPATMFDKLQRKLALADNGAFRFSSHPLDDSADRRHMQARQPMGGAAKTGGIDAEHAMVTASARARVVTPP